MKNEKCLLIDRLLTDNWFSNIEEALPWMMARKILVNDQPATSLKAKIAVNAKIRIREYYKKQYVNKGGLKLQGALRDFRIDASGKIALDCGASTGGFTDCLIQSGAQKVYAVDVGHGQLAGKLQINPNVVNLERTNLGDPILLNLYPVPELITLDLSYLSLTKAVPICGEIVRGNKAQLIALVKPLFEVADSNVKRSGDDIEPAVLQHTLNRLCHALTNEQTCICGITNSPVSGNRGTIEFFLWISLNGQQIKIDLEQEINTALEQAQKIGKFDKNNCSGNEPPLASGCNIEREVHRI